MSMKICIGADIVPTKANIKFFQSGNVKQIIGDELALTLSSFEYRIFNLEVPLTGELRPILKCGPNLIAPTNTINGIKGLDPTLLTLANNHILDQGPQGLFSTMKMLDDHEIGYIGAGESIKDAKRPYILEKEGIRVGIYACAEHEFTIATRKRCGANPFDPLESLDDIVQLKKECDYVVVLYHGGKEYYQYPSPQLQKICRKICEKGANLIVCQHSHCIGSKEEYKGSTIIYGQGNFIFNQEQNREVSNTSMLVGLDLDKKKFEIDYIPLVKHEYGVRVANGDESKMIIHKFNERSNQIKKEEFIVEEYAKFADSIVDLYLVALGGSRFIWRLMRKLFGAKIIRYIYSKEARLKIQNYIECEAHRELLLRGIKKNY